jgi:hypothetical protein
MQPYLANLRKIGALQSVEVIFEIEIAPGKIHALSILSRSHGNANADRFADYAYVLLYGGLLLATGFLPT